MLKITILKESGEIIPVTLPSTTASVEIHSFYDPNKERLAPPEPALVSEWNHPTPIVRVDGDINDLQKPHPSVNHVLRRRQSAIYDLPRIWITYRNLKEINGLALNERLALAEANEPVTLTIENEFRSVTR